MPAAVIPNRTLPQVEAPRVGLQFAAQPTKAEIFQARVFDEPLVTVGGEPTADENRALATALLQHSQRSRADDFGRLTRFLDQHPKSPWRAALLTGLGLEYYQTAYYSRALAAWQEAWELGQKATDAKGKFLADRTLCELAGLYTRLGRMQELEALLKSIEGRVLLGGNPERINLAREALFMMQHQPEISFRCGPLALQSIRHLLAPEAANDGAIFNSASTQEGFSLPQVAALSQTVGLNYQMAFRNHGGEFVIPSVVHWKVGHYAALVRQVGDKYLLEDTTFGHSVWATREALETETSGYFLIPPGELPAGWRSVAKAEGGTVWGKGVTSGIDPDNYTPEDQQGGICGNDSIGMAISRVHLGLVSLQIRDTPVGYTPPVGPAVRFTVRYNHRDYLQPASQVSLRFGPKWTHDWHAFIGDNPSSPLANVKYYVGGGGVRTFTGFNTNTQRFIPQQLDQTRLTRTGANSYEMLFPDGSKRIFGLRAGNSVLLTQLADPAGNAVTLHYDGSLRLVALTDAIGQVTTIAYEHPVNSLLITKVTDPFGRFATFDYAAFDLLFDHDNNTNTPPEIVPLYALTNITDVLGLTSRFEYQGAPTVDTNMVINRLITPYGTTAFAAGQIGTTRSLETVFPDGSRERVEYNQASNLGIPGSDPPASLPQGMPTFNSYLYGRNTYYWSRNACATAYGDYTKARIYHWLHSPNPATTAGILESTKEPLEGRIWYSYAGQGASHTVGTSDRPIRVGRVLDDGTTQLFSFAYNEFGNQTSSIDPVGRTFSYDYAANGIDLVNVRQTRGANNESVISATYNPQHQPLTITDAAGQTTTNTYNSRGQLVTTTNPKGETTTLTYNPDGYLLLVDGPLPGSSDALTFTYDPYGRVRTRTDTSGYTLTFDYDALDRLTRVTYPDATIDQYTYHRLDLVSVLDSANRLVSFEYDKMRQLLKQTDPLGRVTRFDWCDCGSLGSLTDPMGRMTTWHADVQGRPVRKRYADGSEISYRYENTTSRLREVIDEKYQISHYTHNRDNTLKSVTYANTAVPTPAVSYTYDQNYHRPTAVTDGTGTTTYDYHSITGSPAPGAGLLASIDGPLPNDTITFNYDKLGRPVATAINGIAAALTYDALGRITGKSNALGSFAYGYAGASRRLVSLTYPNSQVTELSYFNNLQDRELQRITHKLGATPISECIYARNVPAGRITSWSQQTEVATPNLHTFGYDAVNQLVSAAITNGGTLVNTYGYAYDPAGNRLTEQVGASSRTASYNPLNQISTSTLPGAARTNEWDAQNRLIVTTVGTQRTEFTYDSFSRLASLRRLTNGVEASLRRFVWCDNAICEERDALGTVTKRFFAQGIKLASGPNAGSYFYTRDQLGSIRELTDANGTVRARYAYDPYGRRTKLSGDLEADFGFAGMFWSAEVNLNLTQFRAYDPELGRWLSRDPLRNAELIEGPNLYAYVANDPVNWTDPLGLFGGEIVEVIGGEMVEVIFKGEIVEVGSFDFWLNKWLGRQITNKEFLAQVDPSNLTKWKRRVPRPISPRLPRISGLVDTFVGGGVTILTMTDCNTVEGIFALVRQGKGGMANKYADRLYKQLQNEGL